MQLADHRSLIASLGKEQRETLLTRSNTPGLIRLAGHWGAIAVCSTLIALEAYLWPLLLVVQGILIIFLFTPLHETVHGTAFLNSKLNLFVANICGFLVFLPPVWFRYFHFAHHRYTHIPEKDPELAMPKPATRLEYAIYLTGVPVWLLQMKKLICNATINNDDTFVPDRAKQKVKKEARLYLAIYMFILVASVGTGVTGLLWLWIFPLLLGQPFLRAYLLAEHAACPHVANMLENSRTTFTSRIVYFLAWNMLYHAEHHAYPAVPFHKLPDFHKFTRKHLKVTQDGYLRFHADYFQSLAANQ